MNRFVERVIAERPNLHFLSDELAQQITEYTGAEFKAGPMNWAVPIQVLRYLLSCIREDQDHTIETGGGYTTIAMAAVARHHTCVTNDAPNAELMLNYMDTIGLPRNKLTLVVESSDVALPKLPADQMFDVAFIDGSHGYPMPALDWHYIDQHLKTGGTIGFDNIEIPAVHDHCEFLRRNGTYRLDKYLAYLTADNYAASFWTKVKDEPRWDLAQKNSYRRVTTHDRKDTLKTVLSNISGKRWGMWPWS